MAKKAVIKRQIVSATLDPDEVRVRAYLIWEEEGRPLGNDGSEYWQRAEANLRQEKQRKRSTRRRAVVSNGTIG